MGVKDIVLVNDIAWLGGQFSAEGVGCLDEWTAYRGKRVWVGGLMLRARTRWPALNIGATATSRLFGLPPENQAATLSAVSGGVAFGVPLADRPRSISARVTKPLATRTSTVCA